MSVTLLQGCLCYAYRENEKHQHDWDRKRVAQAALSPQWITTCEILTRNTLMFKRKRRKLILTRYQLHMSWTMRGYYRVIICLLTAVENGGNRVKIHID